MGPNLPDPSKDIRTKVAEQMKGELGTDAKLKALIAEVLLPGVKGPQAESASQISSVARGALQGYFLLGKDLAPASVKVMTAVFELAMDNGLDPEFAMRWALVGVAQAGQVAPPGTLDNIRGALESAFLGVGPVFEKTCRELAAKPGFAAA